MVLSPKPLPPDDLPELMAKSFFAMRWALFLVGVGLPPLLWVWAWMAQPDHPVPDSISGYYHTAARDLLVGALAATGLMLILYKAFNKYENVLLNVSGIAAVGVAFFPCQPDPGATDNSTVGFWVHGVFAQITFGTLGVVAVFFGPTTVKLLHDAVTERRFRVIYRVLGVLMIVLPLIAIVTTAALKASHSTFWVESAGVWAFAAYWLTKTIEYRKTNVERDAVLGTLRLEGTQSEVPAH